MEILFILFMLFITVFCLYIIVPLMKKEKENYDFVIKKNKLIVEFLEKKLNIDADFKDLD